MTKGTRVILIIAFVVACILVATFVVRELCADNKDVVKSKKEVRDDVFLTICSLCTKNDADGRNIANDELYEILKRVCALPVAENQKGVFFDNLVAKCFLTKDPTTAPREEKWKTISINMYLGLLATFLQKRGVIVSLDYGKATLGTNADGKQYNYSKSYVTLGAMSIDSNALDVIRHEGVLATVAWFIKNMQVATLTLSKCCLDIPEIITIAELDLKNLYMLECELPNGWARILGSGCIAKTLSELNLAGSAVDAANLKLICELPKVKHLGLNDCSLPSGCCSALADGVPNKCLDRLYISGNDLLQPSDIEAIYTHFLNIRVLYIERCKLGVGCFENLVRYTRLTHLYAAENTISAGYKGRISTLAKKKHLFFEI